jgi:hypothetical protein
MSSESEPAPPGKDRAAAQRRQNGGGREGDPSGRGLSGVVGGTSDERVGVMQVDPSSGLDTSVVHPARRYNYWLGGKDNFAVDRESGEEIAKIYPSVRSAAIH